MGFRNSKQLNLPFERGGLREEVLTEFKPRYSLPPLLLKSSKGAPDEAPQKSHLITKTRK
jgi:hypothetical protein